MRKFLSRYIGIPLKTLVTIAAVWYIYEKLRTEGSGVWHHFRTLPTENMGLWLLALLLMPLNWGLEAQKWLWMVRKFYPHERFISSFQSVFAGIATGIFTPNRVGEYAGRILFLAAGNRLEAVVLLFIDRICQMLVTLLMGTLSLLLLIATYEELIVSFIAERAPHFTATHLKWVSILLILNTILTWWLAFSPRLVHRIGSRIAFLMRYRMFATAINTLLYVDRLMLLQIFIICIARNIVFSLQYLILLYVFGYHGDTTLAMVLIWIIFLIKSVLPSIALSELGVREATAIFVMGIFSIPQSVAFGSTFVLYVLNIILPAIIGLFFMYKIKINTSPNAPS